MKIMRVIWKIIFGRTTILILLMLLQAVVIFGGFAILDREILSLNYAIGALAIIILMYIVNVRQNSSFKLMWIIFILAIPVVGVTFYLFTRVQPGTRFIAKRIDELLKEEEPFLKTSNETAEKIKEESKEEYGFFYYMQEEAHYPVYDEADVKYFPLGEDKYREMIVQLEKAERFIFMEYFIVDKGEMWSSILSILRRKVEQGVEVRFLYDGTCMLALLPKNYPEQMERMGIKCKVFSPMKPFLTTHQNNRDHRKILVIDGHTAFTGGVNIADEYINKRERFGHWKDTAIMVKGDAVASFTLMFLQMWNIDEKTNENYGKYLMRDIPYVPGRNVGGYIAPYGDSPFDNEEVGERVYFDILNRAKDYVHIMTPYLILDEETVNVLTYAAQRGIDVKIILPHVPDKRYAYYLARTHYRELMEQGVQIYEYLPGFVHAKVFTSDDEKAVVGTINLDYRSLYLHFECAAYIWKNPVVYDIESDFQTTLRKCKRMTLKDCDNYSTFGKIAGKLLRFIAPLM